MTSTAWLAAAGILLFAIAGAVFFYIGRKLGRTAELARQQQARATAEETSKRILGEAEREAESLRKTGVLSGKEELMKLREEWEVEVRSRREEVEREERKVEDKEGQLNRKYDLLEQRERETTRRVETITVPILVGVGIAHINRGCVVKCVIDIRRFVGIPIGKGRGSVKWFDESLYRKLHRVIEAAHTVNRLERVRKLVEYGGLLVIG